MENWRYIYIVSSTSRNGLVPISSSECSFSLEKVDIKLSETVCT